MAIKNLMVFLVVAFALAAFASNVSAFGQITDVEVNEVNALSGIDFANFAGETVKVKVTFLADTEAGLPENAVLAEDVRVKAWFSGERENAAASERFDVLNARTYTRFVSLNVPFDLNNELDEPRKLNIVVESKEKTADEVEIDFTVQRESYKVQILAVDMQSGAKAGESLTADVVLKNRGRQLADDVFLKVKIPELGLETTTYYGDLSAVDQSNPDKEDAVERRTFLRIPVSAPAGLYTVEFEVFNDDSFVSTQRRVVISGASEGALTISSSTSKTFSVGETAEYKLTIVNRDSTVGVYTLEVNAPSNLNVNLGDDLVVVPAGSSKTVSVFANSAVRDDYTFTVKVNSEERALVSQETFMANVVENGVTRIAGKTNATVLLTVILAIIFIVLLVVLIVLLTRKPEKTEEFGESYY